MHANWQLSGYHRRERAGGPQQQDPADTFNHMKLQLSNVGDLLVY